MTNKRERESGGREREIERANNLQTTFCSNTIKLYFILITYIHYTLDKQHKTTLHHLVR